MAEHAASTEAIPGNPCRARRRWRCRWPRFSLRALLGLVTLLTLPAGWLAMEIAEARREQSAIEALPDATVYFDYQRPPNVSLLNEFTCDDDAVAPCPDLVRRLLGGNLFARVVCVAFRSNALAEGSALKHLATFRHVESLTTYNGRMSDHNLRALSELHGLRYLSLSGIPDEGLAYLSRLERLECLVLRGEQLTGIGLACLSRCRRLTRLDIDGVPITAGGAHAIGELATLESLDCYGPLYLKTTVGDAILESCARLRELKSLSAGLRPITDSGVRHLRGHPNLSQVGLRHTQVTDEGFGNLASIPSLATLDVSGCKGVTDAGLKRLRRASMLEELNLSDTPITDGGLDALRSLPRLRILALGLTQVSDACAGQLVGFPSLDKCYTPFTAVTPDGEKRIASVLKRASSRK